MSYEKLALAVIKQAVTDALRNDNRLKNKGRQQQSVTDKEEAIRFLTLPNEDFDFWCLKANLDSGSVRIAVKNILNDPSQWNVLINRLKEL